MVVDSTDTIPGAANGATFDQFREYGRDGDDVFFLGLDSSFQRGVYIRNLATGQLETFASNAS